MLSGRCGGEDLVNVTRCWVVGYDATICRWQIVDLANHFAGIFQLRNFHRVTRNRVQLLIDANRTTHFRWMLNGACEVEAFFRIDLEHVDRLVPLGWHPEASVFFRSNPSTAVPPGDGNCEYFLIREVVEGVMVMLSRRERRAPAFERIAVNELWIRFVRHVEERNLQSLRSPRNRISISSNREKRVLVDGLYVLGKARNLKFALDDRIVGIGEVDREQWIHLAERHDVTLRADKTCRENPFASRESSNGAFDR